ncbi:MAG: MinD/ParA family protein [Deltaproteobacteria bacterium]|nr:MinD/ParA family protein [Deltaproteobacteria bacterium]
MLRSIMEEEGGTSKPSEIPSRERNEGVRVIAVTSGKGGVGKTNIAANFAYITALKGKRTLLVDADAGLANIDVILGITPEFNLYHVLRGEKKLSEVIVTGPGGIRILPASSGIAEMTDLSRGSKLTLLEELQDIDEPLDFIFIDTAAGIAGNVMYFNMVAKEIVVVVTPEPTSLTDAYALIKLLYKNYGAKRFKLVTNMVKNAAESKAVFSRLSRATEHFLNLSIDYLGLIPFDPRVQETVKRQCLLAQGYPKSKAVQSLKSIVDKLMKEEPDTYDRGTIKFFGRSCIERL